MSNTTEMLLQYIREVREQLLHGLSHPIGNCPVDQRYTPEWGTALNHLDITLGNIDADPHQHDQVASLNSALSQVVVPTMAIQEGYLQDLANCDECNEAGCVLKIRARFVLSLRAALQ